MDRLLVLRREEEDEAGHYLSALAGALEGRGLEVALRPLAAKGLLGAESDRGVLGEGEKGEGERGERGRGVFLLVDGGLLGLLHGSAALARTIALLSPALLAPAPSALITAREALLAHLLPRLGLALAATKATASLFAERLALPPGRLLVLPPGGDGHAGTIQAALPPASAATPRILIPVFGPEVALATPFAALARLFDLRFQITLALMGDDPARGDDPAGDDDSTRGEAIARQAAAAGLPPVEIIPRAGRESLSADLLLLPEDRGAIGVAAAWAAAQGLPVALGVEQAGRELIAEGAAAFYPAGDAVQLSRALRRMIADPELRQAMRHQAAAKAGEIRPWAERGARLARVVSALESFITSVED
jgi:hypothetical protein